MKFVRLIISLLILASFNSCKEEKPHSEKQSKPEQNIFADYPEISVPYIDSTSFDNFDFKKKSLKKEEVEKLKLNELFSNLNYSKDAKVFIKQKIKLSDKFNSIVAVCASEHEISTVLITYDNQLKIIGYEEIAYDEIAESCRRKTAKISKEKLEITESDFCNDSVTNETFEIESNGKISAVHAK